MSPVWNPGDEHLRGELWQLRLLALVLLVVFALGAAQGQADLVPALLFVAVSWLTAEVLYRVARWWRWL
jgi:hypothetical protein